MCASLNSDPSDPDVIIKLDISNAFNVLCRRLTLDVLGGKASCDYACGLKEGDNIETVCTELRNMFSYFKALVVHMVLKYSNMLSFAQFSTTSVNIVTFFEPACVITGCLPT